MVKCAAVLEKLKTKVAAVDPSKERKALIVVQFNITDGGSTVATWTVDLKNLKVTTEAFSGTPDLTITVDDDTICKIAAKTLTMADAKAQGLAKVEGNEEAMKLLAYLQEQITS